MSDERVETGRSWDVDEALRGLETAASVHGDEEVRLAHSLFKSNLPLAVMSIVHIAQHAPKDADRFKAAAYIVERNLGSIRDVNPTAANDPLMDLMADIVVDGMEGEAIERARQKYAGVDAQAALPPEGEQNTNGGRKDK
jgi:hypothetical protein